mgnify:CR=1 FL=1
MRCTKCNHELDEHGICPNCYHIHDVQTMSNREINNFDGITIEDENNLSQRNKLKKISNNINNLIIIDIIVHHVLVA